MADKPPEPPRRRFVRPSTKAKQREFVRLLIARVRGYAIGHKDIARALDVLLSELHNRSGKRGRLSSPPIWRVKPEIIALHHARPELSDQEISQILSVSIGRVSETLSGKRL